MSTEIERGGKYITVERRPDGTAYIWVSDMHGEASIILTADEVEMVMEELTAPKWLGALFIEVRPDTDDGYYMSRVDDKTWIDQYGHNVSVSVMLDLFKGVDIRVIA